MMLYVHRFSPEFISYLGFFAKCDSVVKVVLKFAIRFKMRACICRFLELKYSWHELNETQFCSSYLISTHSSVISAKGKKSKLKLSNWS